MREDPPSTEESLDLGFTPPDQVLETGEPPALDESRKTLLANLRHDLRTPLNAIIGYCEMLVEEAEDFDLEDETGELEKVLEGGNQLLALVNNILDAGKVEAGHIEPDPDAFSKHLYDALIPPLKEVIERTQPILTRSEEQGRSDAVGDLSKILTAGERFRNLLRDFRGFSRMESSTVRDRDRDRRTEAPAPPSTVQSRSFDDDKPLGPAVVLVVDDNENNRDLLRRLLNRQGHAVFEAENGFQALALLKTRTFDIALLDVMMPEIDGYELARRIRQDPQTADLPIIMVTALGSKEHRLQAVEAGANDFLSKPVDKVELRVRLNSLLRIKQAQDEIKRHRAELEITVERRTEALRHQTELYRSVLNASADAIVLIDLREQVQYVSPSFTRVFGWSLDELLGKPLPYTPDDQIEASKQLADLVLRKGETLQAVETQRLTRGGNVRDVLLSSSRYHDQQGRPAGMMVSLTDITERKRAEEQLAEEQRQRTYIRETFGKYLSEDVVTEILESRTGVNLGGEFREITILVSDLRGFTPLTESMEPEKLVVLLNRYLELMTDVIISHKGSIDKFMGDGILVYFGAPRMMPNHAAQAVACALEMQRVMPGLNAENTGQGLPELKMGIGINTGTLVVGNIGSERRKEYGAVGSPINMAFRVEGQTTAGEVLVTPSVYERVQPNLEVAFSREAKLKGIEHPVTLYSVTGLRTPPQPDTEGAGVS